MFHACELVSLLQTCLAEGWVGGWLLILRLLLWSCCWFGVWLDCVFRKSGPVCLVVWRTGLGIPLTQVLVGKPTWRMGGLLTLSVDGAWC